MHGKQRPSSSCAPGKESTTADRLHPDSAAAVSRAASSAGPPSFAPPPFSTLDLSPPLPDEREVAAKTLVLEPDPSIPAQTVRSHTLLSQAASPSSAVAAVVDHAASAQLTRVPSLAEQEVKAALPQDTKAGPSGRSGEEPEPPPPYEEGDSPLQGFQYVMAAAGGAASIITQVQQGGPAPVNTLGGACCRLPASEEESLTAKQMSAQTSTSCWI